MECSHDEDPHVSAEPPTTTRKFKAKPPKRKRKFGRANFGDDGWNKKARNGAAAAAAATHETDQPTAAAAAAPAISNQQRRVHQSQQIQALSKKGEGLFNECAKLNKQLVDSDTNNKHLQQEVLRLQQQLKDQEGAHNREVLQLQQQLKDQEGAHNIQVDELKASHKVEINKQINAYRLQQKRYRTLLSSNIDHANERIEEAKAMKSEAGKQ
eukprot:scaffold13440_cov80-Skeletonema_menzelii.AAC.1